MKMTIQKAREFAAKHKGKLALHDIAMKLLARGFAGRKGGAVSLSTVIRLAKAGGAPVRKTGRAAAKPRSKSEAKRTAVQAKPALKAAATAKRVAKKRRPLRKARAKRNG